MINTIWENLGYSMIAYKITNIEQFNVFIKAANDAGIRVYFRNVLQPVIANGELFPSCYLHCQQCDLPFDKCSLIALLDEEPPSGYKVLPWPESDTETGRGISL